MPKLISTIGAAIVAKTANFEKGMAKARAAADRFQKSAVGINRKLKRIGKQAQKVGKKMTAGLTAPILLLGGLAVKAFADFEQEMAKVKAVSGATGKEFETLKTLAESLGESTRFTASEVATLQLNYSKLGFIPAEIEKITGATLNLALATGEDLANSAEVAGSTLRGLGLLAKEMPRVVDVMAQSFSSSALDLESFKEAMKLVAPTAKATGRDIEEVTSMLGLLANNGIKGSVAGTQLNRVFIELNKKGITLEQAMDKVANSSNGLASATDLVKDRGAKALLILTAQRKELAPYEKSLRGAAGAAEKMAKIMDDTLQGSLFKLKSAVEGAAISFGEELKPIIEKVASVVASAANTFSGLSSETKKMIMIVTGVVAVAGPLVFILGTVATAAAAISAPILIVIAALAALTIGIGAYVAANSKVSDTLRETNIELNAEFTVLKKANTSQKDRIKLIKGINEKYGEYLPNLLTEKSTLEDIEAAQKAANTALRDRIALVAKQEIIAEAEQKLVQAQSLLFKSEIGIEKLRIKASKDQDRYGKILKASITINADLKKTVNELTKEYNALDTSLGVLAPDAEAAAEALDGIDSPDDPDAPDAPDAPDKDDPFSGMGNSISSVSSDIVFMNEAIKESKEALEGLKNPFDGMSTSISSASDDLAFFNETADLAAKAAAKLKAQAEAVGAAVGASFQAMGNKIVESFISAETGAGRFMQVLAKTALQAIATALATAIGAAIQGASVAAAFTGPAAPFTQPAFLATMVGGVLSAFAAIPKFADGGLVTGATMAMVGEGAGNSRSNPEVIAPLDKLQGMLGGQGGGGTLTARVSGKDLLFVLRNQGIRNDFVAPGNNFTT